MGDLDLHFQGHLAIFDLEFSQFGSCNKITLKSLARIWTKFAQNMYLTVLQTLLNYG